MKPRISVLLPVRNGASTLGRAMESVLAQSLDDFELIVIDDHSTDATAHVAASFSSDRRVVVREAVGEGLVDALNQGLEECAARFAARLDADDWMMPNRLQVQTAMLENDVELSLVASPVIAYDGDGMLIGTRSSFVTDAAMKLILLRETGFAHSSVAYRVSDVTRLGGYLSSAFPAEDYELWTRLALRGGKWAGVQESLTCIQVAPGSVSTSQGERQRSAAGGISAAARKSALCDYASRETVRAEIAANPPLRGSPHLARLQQAALWAAKGQLQRGRPLQSVSAAMASAYSVGALLSATALRRSRRSK